MNFQMLNSTFQDMHPIFYIERLFKIWKIITQDCQRMFHWNFGLDQFVRDEIFIDLLFCVAREFEGIQERHFFECES